LKVLDPNQAYAMLWEALTGERVTPLHAASLLDTQFKKAGPGRVPWYSIYVSSSDSSVVLLDELDQLVMAKQTVLYNLFNWPTLPNSRLIVVAIANTMNLADMLPNKIQSRVGIVPLSKYLTQGLTRVNFEPYTTSQLVRIIESRLENVPGNIVESDAIRLCAMRIANNTGDARKALDVCRYFPPHNYSNKSRAVEIAEASAESNLPSTPSKRSTNVDLDGGKVTTKLLSSVLQEFLRHPIQLTLRNIPFTSKLFLAALMLRNRRLSGKSDVTYGDVLEESTRICMTSVNNGQAKVVMKGVTTPKGLENAGVELEACKIIDWEERGGRRGGRVGLQISEDDLNMAFQQDQEWKDMVR
jgi:origin recognition complex subunit 1